MKLTIHPFHLKFRHPFRIATGTRDTTPVVFAELSHDGLTGYGEAALPPYLTETQESVIAFLKRIDVTSIPLPQDHSGFGIFMKSLGAANYAGKAALNMALYDLYGKTKQTPVYKIWNDDLPELPLNSFTLGMDSPALLTEKLLEAKDFQLLKVKLGGPFDNLIIKTLREHTKKAICVDVNQGWTDPYFALDMITWLAGQNVIFVEQPLPKEMKKEYAWLKSKSPIPVIADESTQHMDDMNEAADLFHGVNIKLMKCGGISEAMRMIDKSKAAGLKVLLGCMSESSCGVSAMAQLAPFADWTDLDGPLLITNDPFNGISYKNGRIVLNQAFGNGVEKKTDVPLIS